LISLDDRVPKGVETFGIPGTRIAEDELGRRIAFNMVMTGFFTAMTDIIGVEAVRKAISDSVPAGTEKFNLKAFNTGYEYGLKKQQ
ncbi:MAG: pyruvate ferredoxin oxidoreductase, partial [Proteobacteria bacterium]|nr:pyruvate ferredoxin oxidoreductase [Pseudomonadota bacterium]